MAAGATNSPLPVGAVVGRNIRNVSLGGPVDRDRLGRILDAGHIGALDLTFVRSLYLLVIISSITLTFAELSYFVGNPIWPFLTCIVVAVSYRRLVLRKPPIIGRLLGNLLSTLAIGKLVLDITGGSSAIMTAVGSLLSLLIWIKLLQNKRNRDFVQILLLSFGQMLVAAVLTQEMWFGIAALLYLLGTTWVMLLFHFKREGDGDFHPLKQQIVDWRMFRTSELISRTFIGVLIFALILTGAGTFLVFISLPRVTSGWLNSLLPNSGRPSTGLTDQVALGGSGTINRNQKTALFVKWDRKPDWPVLYRAVVQDEYNPKSHIWSNSYRNETFYPVIPVDDDLFASGSGHGEYRVEITDMQQPRALRQLVSPGIPVPARIDRRYSPPLPLMQRGNDGRNWVHAAVAIQKPEDEELQYAPETGVVRTDRMQRAQVDYVVRVTRPPTGPEYARARAFEVPGSQYPFQDDDGEHRGIMRQWVREHMGAENVPTRGWTVADINRLMTVLTSAPYSYTLEQEPPPPGVDPVRFFLMERKAGHCEYFASALCMLLMAYNVEARMVTGFGDSPNWEQQDDQRSWLHIITYASAHAWVEVKIQGYGWQPFNPSPEVGAMPEPMSDWDRWIAAMQYRWRKHVVQFDLAQQIGILRWLRQALRDIRTWLTDLGSVVSSPFGLDNDSPVPLIVGGTVVAIPIVVMIVFYRRWRRRRPRVKSMRSTFEPLQELLALLERRGLARRPSQTAAEFLAGDAGVATMIPPADATGFLHAYHSARFGGTQIAPEQEKLIARVIRAVRESKPVPVSAAVPTAPATRPSPPVDNAPDSDSGNGSRSSPTG